MVKNVKKYKCLAHGVGKDEKGDQFREIHEGKCSLDGKDVMFDLFAEILELMES